MKCPACNRPINEHVGLEEEIATLKEGDFGVCVFCGAWLRREATRQYRLFTPEDLNALSPKNAFFLGSASREIIKRQRTAASTN